MPPPVDDTTLIQAADDFYRALNHYYTEPSTETLNDLMIIAKHYRTLGCRISLIKHGQCIIVSRYNEVAQCQPTS